MSQFLAIRPLRVIAALAVMLTCCASASNADQSLPTLKGRSLQDALRILQQEGLRIVFSSDAVTSEMRVLEEPRGRNRRAQLDDLLKPHGLKAVSGPGPVIQVVARHTSMRRAGSGSHGPSSSPAPSRSLVPQAYSDAVLVRARSEDRETSGGSFTLDLQRLQAARGAVDDVLQAVQALPRVASVDDYRGEFSVRGSPYRHVGSVIDGIATPWLLHSVYGRTDLGSLSMLSSEAMESVTLRAGAYPQRYGDRLGAELEMTLREGSRESRQFHGSVGGTALAVVAEGPIGEGRRGSWIVSMRNSYLDWPVKRRAVGGSFAFADASAKLVYDVSPSQQLTFTALGGRSRLDGPDDVVPGALAVGTNDAMLFSLGWRTSLGSRGMVRQSVAVIDQRLSNALQEGQSAGGARNHELAYHVDVRHTLAGGRIEGGLDVSRLDGMRELLLDRGIGPSGAAGPTDANLVAQWWARSAYVHFDRVVRRTVSVGGGVRIASSTLVPDSIASPWLLSQWRFRQGWAINASIGVAHQFPELDSYRSTAAASLRPERATHLDIGLERRLVGSYRWQATFFSRQERDLLGQLQTELPVIGDPVTTTGVLRDYRNILTGRSRGVEVILAREGASKLTGWISYAYGRTRQTDTVTNETFWADFDRRHAFSAVVMYRFSPVMTMEVDYRASTNVPIAGHLTDRDGMLFEGARRNGVRLPDYARLDARAQRTFGPGARKVSVFGEMLNLFNRHNLGPAEGVIDAQTGRAFGFTRELMPRRVSVGVAIHF